MMGEPTALKTRTDSIRNLVTEDFTVIIGDTLTIAEINAKNAQLFRLERKGVDVMYPGGAPETRRPIDRPLKWKGSSPIIFPIFGPPNSIDEKTGAVGVLIDGVFYPMSQHGFGRDLNWEMTGSDMQSATFEANYTPGQEVPNTNKGTISRFPNFCWLIQNFEVVQGTLIYTLEIENTSDKVMHYGSAGWHSGFRPLEEPSIIKVFQGDVQKECTSPYRVHEAEGNGIAFANVDTVVYENWKSSIKLKQTFGNIQAWYRDLGDVIALEPVSGFPLSKSVDLAQPGNKTLEPRQRAVYTANIDVSVR